MRMVRHIMIGSYAAPLFISDGRRHEYVCRFLLEDWPAVRQYLSARKLAAAYECAWTATVLFVPRWMAPIVRRVSVWRDATASAWGKHCFEMGLITSGQRAPWPSWLQWGWK